MDNIPKASVVENNGEISCSVEETNRIRAMLGLKPLRTEVDRSAKSAVQSAPPVAVPSANPDNDIRERILKAKQERMKGQSDGAAPTGAGLGELLSAQSLSAADWVTLSRQSAATGPAAVPQAKKRTFLPDLDEMDRSLMGRVPAGMKIKHQMEDFQEGQEVILTLKDSTILDEKGNALADDDDELENVHLTEAQRTQDALERKRKANLPVYTGRDDDEFGRNSGAARGPLAHYDEEENYKRRHRAALIITQDGTVEDTEAAAKVRARLANAAVLSSRLDFDVSNSGLEAAEHAAPVIRDYVTPEELAAARERAKAKKKQKKLRTRTEAAEDWDGPTTSTAQQSTAVDIVEQLRQEAEKQGTHEDRGSRAQRRGEGGVGAFVATNEAAGAIKSVNISAQTQQELEALRTQRKAFDSALSRAQAKSSATMAGTQRADADIAMDAPAVPAPTLNGDALNLNGVSFDAKSTFSGQHKYANLRQVVHEAQDEDYDAELNAIVARARRLTAAKQDKAHTERAPAVPDVIPAVDVGESIAATLAGADDRTKQRNVHRAVVDNEGPGLVFTETSEFSNLLQSRLHDDRPVQSQEASGAVVDEETARIEAGAKRRRRDISQPAEDGNVESGKRRRTEDGLVRSERSEDRDWRAHASDDDGASDIPDQAEAESAASEEEADAGFTGEEPAVNKGLGGALAMLSRSGMLSQKEKYRGRATDYREQDYDKPVEDAAGHTIVLEYKDEFGRKLTQRQAFRELSYKFHGQKPSQKQRDKMVRREKREHLQETASASLAAVQAVAKLQQATGSAYISLGK